MRIAVVTSDKPGISTTLVGEQVMDGLRTLGVDVVPVVADGRAGTSMNVKPLSRTHAVCLLEHKAATILKNVRYSRPLSLTSVWTGNVEGYELPDLLAYMALFFEPRFAGVPVAHVSHSRHTQAKLRSLAAEVLQPTVARGFLDRTRTLLYGIDRVFQVGCNDPDVLIAPMNRVVQGAKNVRQHSEMTRSYAALQALKGRSVRTLFYHAPGFGPADTGVKADLSVYEFHPQPENRAEYVQNARVPGMFLSTSQWESFGIYYLELLCSGVVGVFLDRPWVRELLPDYRFVAPARDLVPMMQWVRENYDEARSYLVQEVVPNLRKTFDLDLFCRGLVEIVQSFEGASA